MISVLDEVETVAGVDTRVVEERESEGGALVEIPRATSSSRPKTAPSATSARTAIRTKAARSAATKGSWRAGKDAAKPGIIMLAKPAVGVPVRPGARARCCARSRGGDGDRCTQGSAGELQQRREDDRDQRARARRRRVQAVRAPVSGPITDPPTELTAFERVPALCFAPSRYSQSTGTAPRSPAFDEAGAFPPGRRARRCAGADQPRPDPAGPRRGRGRRCRTARRRSGSSRTWRRCTTTSAMRCGLCERFVEARVLYLEALRLEPDLARPTPTSA